MDFISDVYSQKQWDDGNQHEVECLGIEHSLFKVLKHEYQVEAGPYGGYIGAEGVFIVVGGCQIDHQQGASGSKHAVDDPGTDENDSGQPVTHWLIRRLYEKILQCGSHNDTAIYRADDLRGHQRMEFDANGHAGQHESHNGEYAFQVKVAAVSPGQQSALMTAMAMSGPNSSMDGGMESMTPANPVRAWTILETKIAAAKITNFNDKDNDIKAGIQHSSFSIVQTHPESCHLIMTKID